MLSYAANDAGTPAGQILRFPKVRSPAATPRADQPMTAAATTDAGPALVNRLLSWFDDARLAGRDARAEQLLLLAWDAYDFRPRR
jgi:hypothetical protein